jgi:arylsulfatase
MFCLALIAAPRALAQDPLDGPIKGDPHPAPVASPTQLPIVLPTPVPPPLGEQIGPTYEFSRQGQILTTRSPAGTPNIVIVLLDDVGFGASETIGGPIRTPTLSKLEHMGLLYNAFHTTALCSPTRAALLTGRNHHAVGTAAITESATGYDGYTSIIPQSAATIAQVLQYFGYNTAAYGKWHNTPPWETGESGPYNHWAVGLGFDTFYGFNGGDTHQFEPELYEGTTPIRTPSRVQKTPNNPDGIYNLNDDLADQAIAWLQMHNSVAPAKPFFIYWAPGGVHAPHQVLPSWSDQYKNRVGGRPDFTEGWDLMSRRTYEQEVKNATIPFAKIAAKTPRPSQIPAWKTCSQNEEAHPRPLLQVTWSSGCSLFDRPAKGGQGPAGAALRRVPGADRFGGRQNRRHPSGSERSGGPPGFR